MAGKSRPLFGALPAGTVGIDRTLSYSAKVCAQCLVETQSVSSFFYWKTSQKPKTFGTIK